MDGHKDKLDMKINGLRSLAYLSGINNKLHKINNKCLYNLCLCVLNYLVCVFLWSILLIFEKILKTVYLCVHLSLCPPMYLTKQLQVAAKIKESPSPRITIIYVIIRFCLFVC